MFPYLLVGTVTTVLSIRIWRDSGRYDDKFTGRIIAVTVIIVGLLVMLAGAGTIRQ